MNWNETTYGEKSYTIKINGVTSSTQSITLTDPNVSTTPSYEFEISNGNLNATFTWDGTSENWPVPYSTGQLTVSNQTARWQSQEYASGYGASPGQFNPGILGVANYGPYDIQQSEAHDSTYHIVFTNNIWSITHSGFTWKITLIDPNASTPPPTQITNLFASHASGTYQTQGCYTAIHSSSTSTLFVYQIGNPSWGGLLADHTISYDTNSKIWADVGSSNPYYVCDGSTWADTTASSANQQTVSFWQSNTAKLFELTNPYYEAPAYRTGTSQNVTFIAGTWNSLGYSLLVDDTPSSASSGITLPNGDKAWDFDLDIPGYGNVNIGEGEFIRFIAGPAVGTGIWSKGTDYDAVRDTVDTNKINFINASDGLDGVFYETNAFVSGLVPYGDIP